MEMNGNGENDYDWAKEVKAFDDSKAGVKGLLDAGVTKLPQFFVHSAKTMEFSAANPNYVELPLVDLGGGPWLRKEVVEEIRKAAGEWGFFRIVNHGVPQQVMDSMLAGAKRFHELPAAEKMQYYSSDGSGVVRFNSNVPRRRIDAACWRDTFACVFHDHELDPEAIPLACRKEMQEYVKYMSQVRETLTELVSETLGLSSDHLSNMECMKSETVSCLYYPICPEPDKTLGTGRHSDQSFLTLLLQDDIGGLQIFHDNTWVDVHPVRGSLVANIGQPMQTITNGTFRSVEHRVLAQSIGPRVSVGCFFNPSKRAASKQFGPIKELL